LSDYFGLSAGDNDDAAGANVIGVLRFQNNVGDGDITALELYTPDSSPTGDVRLGMYEDNAGAPGSLIFDAGATAVVNGWCVIAALSQAVTSGTWYWLAYNLESSNIVRYQSGSPASSHQWDGYAYGALPATLSPDGYNDNQYVMRAYVTTGGALWEKSFSDSMTIADVIKKGVWKPEAEAVSLADVVIKSTMKPHTEAVTLADVILKTVSKAPTDDVTIADSFSRTASYCRPFLDTVTLADSPSKGVGKPIADTMTIADSINIVKLIKLILADTVAIIDTLLKSIRLGKTENVAINDGLAKSVSMAKTDTVALADAIAKGVSTLLVDTVTIVEGMVANIVHLLVLNLSDLVTIADHFDGVLTTKTYLRQVIAHMGIKRQAIARMPLFRWIIRRWSA